jgi:hypothetical protein
VLVVADQHGHDDLFTGRALTGDAGQRLQAWLTAAGLTVSYAIVRTLPVDADGAPAATVRAAVDHPQVQAIHAEVQRRLGSAEVVLALGPRARRLLGRVNVRHLPVVEMKATFEAGWSRSWAVALDRLSALSPRRDQPPRPWDGRRGQVARLDLPFGTLRWQATSGDRALPPNGGAEPSAAYRKLVMPAWAAALDPPP